jgi:hypothetical protein
VEKTSAINELWGEERSSRVRSEPVLFSYRRSPYCGTGCAVAIPSNKSVTGNKTVSGD